MWRNPNQACQGMHGHDLYKSTSTFQTKKVFATNIKYFEIIVVIILPEQFIPFHGIQF